MKAKDIKKGDYYLLQNCENSGFLVSVVSLDVETNIFCVMAVHCNIFPVSSSNLISFTASYNYKLTKNSINDELKKINSLLKKT